MKKVVSLLAVLFLFASVSFAVTVSTKTYVGIADFSGSGSIDFSFTLRNLSDDGVAQRLSWSSTDAFVGGSTVKWVKAEQYAVVVATVTKAGFNVYMYQTNKNSTQYKAEVARTNDNDPAKTVYNGLVNKDLHGGEYKGYIPVAYSFVGKKQSDITYDIATATVTAKRADRFFVDAADYNAATEFPNGIGNYTKIASLVGPVFGQGEYGDWTGDEVTNNTAFMYFFGGFSNITGGEMYGTDQLHVIQVTE